MSNSRFRTPAFRALQIGVCIVALPLTGCGLFSPKDAPPEPPPTLEIEAPISPGAVLRNLEEAHRFRNIDVYEATLDSMYVFIPNPDDDEVDFTDLPFEEDLDSTRNMFRVVDRIEIDLTFPNDQGEPSDFAQFPAVEGYRKMSVASVRLDVTTRELIEGDPLIYQVAGDPATFIFKPDMSASPVTYKIVYQQDDS